MAKIIRFSVQSMHHLRNFVTSKLVKMNLDVKSPMKSSSQLCQLFNFKLLEAFQSKLSFRSLISKVTSLVSGTLALSWISKSPEKETNPENSKIEVLILEADQLYNELKFDELYNLLLDKKESKNDEILWRLARSIYEKVRNSSPADKQKSYKEALEYLEEAEKINEKNFAVHKWIAVIMDCLYTIEGTKSRISHLYDMKKHMERACQLKPNDGTSWYVLGMWYFGIANIAWYERKAAELFFATPPQATYEEALHIFLQAEKVEPGFYSQNDLMIGKCLYYMGRKSEAKECFTKVKNHVGKTADDEDARKEAQKWL